MHIIFRATKPGQRIDQFAKEIAALTRNPKLRGNTYTGEFLGTQFNADSPSPVELVGRWSAARGLQPRLRA